MKSKYRMWFCLLLVTGFGLIIINSCEKENPVALPEISTSPLTDITSTSAISGGSVISDGGSSISARGVCWDKNQNPTLSAKFSEDGEGPGNYSSSLTGLINGTYYYVRAYATNNAGTAYGNEFLMITPVSDLDGNIYKTVIIGTQVWMAENLRTTKLNNNTSIPMVNENSSWSALSTPAYCLYNNDDYYNKQNYGSLYNWFTINTGKLCPEGWHVPSEAEWTTLTDYLGGVYVASGKLKEEGGAHWTSPNTGASDDFGFSARPGGYRTGLSAASFRTKGYYGWWWVSTESDPNSARARLMTYDASEIAMGSGLKKNGYSVRCVKD